MEINQLRQRIHEISQKDIFGEDSQRIPQILESLPVKIVSEINEELSVSFMKTLPDEEAEKMKQLLMTTELIKVKYLEFQSFMEKTLEDLFFNGWISEKEKVSLHEKMISPMHSYNHIQEFLIDPSNLKQQIVSDLRKQTVSNVIQSGQRLVI